MYEMIWYELVPDIQIKNLAFFSLWEGLIKCLSCKECDLSILTSTDIPSIRILLYANCKHECTTDILLSHSRNKLQFLVQCFSVISDCGFFPISLQRVMCLWSDLSIRWSLKGNQPFDYIQWHRSCKSTHTSSSAIKGAWLQKEEKQILLVVNINQVYSHNTRDL